VTGDEEEKVVAGGFALGAEVEVKDDVSGELIAATVIYTARNPDGQPTNYFVLLSGATLVENKHASHLVHARTASTMVRVAVEHTDLRAARIKYLIAYYQLWELKSAVKRLICYSWSLTAVNTEVFWREKYVANAYDGPDNQQQQNEKADKADKAHRNKTDKTDKDEKTGKDDKEDEEGECNCADKDEKTDQEDEEDECICNGIGPYSPRLLLWKVSQLNRGDDDMAIELHCASNEKNIQPFVIHFQPRYVDNPVLGLPRFSQTIKSLPADDSVLAQAAILVVSHCWTSSIILSTQ
jgi:hypothetical protein